MTQSEIVQALRELGLCKNDKVLVHSSLVALGHVEGGADAVIDALLEAVGPDGLVVVPTFACKPPFDRKTSATGLGKIPDSFWRRPEALRSLHPTHSVAAIGKGAKKLIKDHEKAPTAYGEDTPYVRMADIGGKILLMGVDQDRNSTLHSGEALAGSPYLKDITAEYIDDDGNAVTIPVAAMAGPHRDFLGLDRLFFETGVMKVGCIGNAVCRLMDTKEMLQVELEALADNPAAVLCDNPECADCVMQRGKIKSACLSYEDFTLAAVASDISGDPDELWKAIQAEGISALEITAAEYPLLQEMIEKQGVGIVAVRGDMNDKAGLALAGKLDVPFIVPATSREDIEKASALAGNVLITNNGSKSSVYGEAYSEIENAPHLAFNPAKFAAAGEKPFLGVFYRGLLRKQTAHFYADDGTVDGRSTFVGRGHGEVKEIISMLRCRSYGGVITLRSHSGGVENFRTAADWFWRLFESM